MSELSELTRLRDTAKRLGFRDDASHWQNEINELEETELRNQND